MRLVEEAFRTNSLSTSGSNIVELEHEFSALVGLPALALNSGTSALHLGIKLLDIRPGDEVLSPTLTFVASCNPVLYECARPVFLDSDRMSWNLDPQLLADFLKKRAATNKLPKALIVVHLFGQSADLATILEICGKYEVKVLEDAAESLGAQYRGKLVGTFGDIGIYSFNGNKVITSSSGGMLVSPRKEWVDKARCWSRQARDPDPSGLKNYLHSEIGYNYGLSNILAGVARGQLEVLELRVQQRLAVFERYRTAFEDLPGIETQPEQVFGMSNVGATFRLRGETDDGGQEPVKGEPDAESGNQRSQLANSRNTRWLSCFLIDEKKFGVSQAELIRYLDAANIESRPVWKPMHTQKLYQGYECIGGAVAEDLNRRGICLPSSSSLTEEDQQFVIDRVREAHFRAVE